MSKINETVEKYLGEDIGQTIMRNAERLKKIDGVVGDTVSVHYIFGSDKKRAKEVFRGELTKFAGDNTFYVKGSDGKEKSFNNKKYERKKV